MNSTIKKQPSAIHVIGDEPFNDDISLLEMELLLESVTRHYGYDFSQYSRKMLRRRTKLLCIKLKLEHLSELIPCLLRDSNIMQQLLAMLSITVTEFFRDPHVFAAFKKSVVPALRTYPFIDFWCAGCATGEEAYSWAITLEEAGLLERSRIYATDINHKALQVARTGIYSQESYDKACANYQKTGGKRSFNDYCQQGYGAFKLKESLLEHITFATHNLVHDNIFGEMSVISCRNVMIYFNTELKQRCINLFEQSLSNQGFLCLGGRETLDYIDVIHNFINFDKNSQFYQHSQKTPSTLPIL